MARTCSHPPLFVFFVVGSLVKTAKNAQKQYRRSRPDPSREGVRRSKVSAAIKVREQSIEYRERSERLELFGHHHYHRFFILTRHEQELLQQYPLPPHPLLKHVEENKLESMRGGVEQIAHTGESATVGDAEDHLKRNDFLQAMSGFRPKETIFEARVGAGGSTKAGQVDKSRNGGSGKKDTMTIMKNMRREMKVVRNKGSLVVAGGRSAGKLNGDIDDDDSESDAGEVEKGESLEEDGGDSDGMEDDEFGVAAPAPPLPQPPQPQHKPPSANEPKRRMSKAERKRAKTGAPAPPSQPLKKKAKTESYKDSENYIDYERNFNQRDREMEAAMQPSAADGRNSKNSALQLEQEMLDIVGDENADMIRKQRVMRWDKSRKKYIQTTLGDEAQGMTHAKKIRLESGGTKSTKDMKLGAMYEKWQKKHGKSIGGEAK